MTSRIEQYALIGDTQTAALVGRRRLDRLALRPTVRLRRVLRRAPRDEPNGRWLHRPGGRRRGRPAASTATARSCSRPSSTRPRARSGSSTACRSATSTIDVVRIVEGISGAVPMKLELIVRFDYGSVVPWVRSVGRHDLDDRRARRAAAHARRSARRATTCATTPSSSSRAGDKVPFVLTWYPSFTRPCRRRSTPSAALDRHHGVVAGLVEPSPRTTASGTTWCSARSITLKALTYAPTGGIVAAPTTSLPEWPAACATGTTATAGCATRRSRSTRS